MAKAKRKKAPTKPVHNPDPEKFFNVEFTLRDGTHVEFENPKPRLGLSLSELVNEAQDCLDITDEEVESFVLWKE